MTEADNNTAVLEMMDLDIASAQSPGRAVIEGVEWRVAVGDYWIVGGPPGSGKSSLLATAAGLSRPARGTHRLFGRELTGLEEAELIRHRLRVGIVFGNEGRLFSQLTVAENVALPICYHLDCEPADVEERVNTLLEATELSPIAHRMPGNVGRGVRQRIALARALAIEPELLLLDNPLREIDPPQRRWWLEFLNRLCAGQACLGDRRMSLVVATDDVRPWLGQGQKFAVIAGNRWQTIASRADLERCGEPVWQELLHDETAGMQKLST